MIFVKGDTEFSAWARQFQNDWRVQRGFPIGTYKNPKGETITLGNYLETDFAFNSAENFLTKNIRNVVKHSLQHKEKGAKISKTRLYTNLLSSQPLAFNLFAELSLDYDLATTFFKRQFENRIKRVTNIIFEHSDGRGDCEYTCDHSAFDVFIEYQNEVGQNGFIGIEVKYSESLKDDPATYKERYAELTIKSELFKADSIELLKKKPLEQIWRDHLLSISHLSHKNKKYNEGFFVYLFPKENKECQAGVDKYIQQFVSFDETTKKYDENKTGFYKRHLKEFVLDLKEVCKDEWVDKFIERYFGNNL
jgi:hypothetical protein